MVFGPTLTPLDFASDSAWSPLTDLTPALFLRADNISGSDGDSVATWTSQDSNAYAFAGQNTPVLKKGANGFNGENVVLLTAANSEYFTLSSVVSTATAGWGWAVVSFNSDADIVLLCVAKTSDNLTFWLLQGKDQDGSSNWVPGVRHRNEGLAISGIVATNPPGSDGTPHLIVWSSNGSSGGTKIWIDGVDEVEQVLSGTDDGDWVGDMTSPDTTAVGANVRSTISQFHDGKIAEIGLVDGAEVSAGDLASLQEYASSRYGVSI